MSFDFRSLLKMDVTRAREVLQQDYAAYAHDVATRFESEEYQKIVTYCLLKGISPAVVAQIIKAYITKGKTPW